MFSAIWHTCYPSICSIKFYNSKGELFKSGTGFKANDCLITNSHVYHTPSAEYVEILFVDSDSHTIRESLTIGYGELKQLLLYGSPPSSWDFSIIDVSSTKLKSVPSLQLTESSNLSIGDPIAILGFQFDQNNLSIKQGIVSSRYTRAGAKYMQVDASVNSGNSGGPLINAIDGSVAGIVTRKHTGLTDAFDHLIKSFEHNIQYLSQSVGHVKIGGIDPNQGLLAGQEQLQIASKEILRSANVGVGFAFELDEIIKYFKGQ